MTGHPKSRIDELLPWNFNSSNRRSVGRSQRLQCLGHTPRLIQ
ncbi:hypothetical protein [Hoeflea sp.]